MTRGQPMDPPDGFNRQQNRIVPGCSGCGQSSDNCQRQTFMFGPMIIIGIDIPMQAVMGVKLKSKVQIHIGTDHHLIKPVKDPPLFYAEQAAQPDHFR